MAEAEEGAAERMVVGIAASRACHGGDGDVGIEFHELVSVGRAVGDALGEGVPVASRLDEIRFGACARALQSLLCPRAHGEGRQGEEEEDFFWLCSLLYVVFCLFVRVSPTLRCACIGLKSGRPFGTLKRQM